MFLAWWHEKVETLVFPFVEHLARIDAPRETRTRLGHGHHLDLPQNKPVE